MQIRKHTNICWALREGIKAQSCNSIDAYRGIEKVPRNITIDSKVVYVRSDMEELKEVCKSNHYHQHTNHGFITCCPHESLTMFITNRLEMWLEILSEFDQLHVHLHFCAMCIFFMSRFHIRVGKIAVEPPSILLIVFIHSSSH